MSEAGGSADVRPFSPSLVGFKPRQVLLAQKQQQRNSTLMGKKNQPDSTAQLKPEQESILAYSVALWFESKGFSKVLKRFLSSAQIQDEDWRAKALDLNEVFSKHLATSNDVHERASPQEKKESLVVGSAQINREVNGEKTESKKKKKKNKGEDALTENGKLPDEIARSEKVKKSKNDGKQEKKEKTTDVLSDRKLKSELNENDPDNAVEKKVSKKRSIDATEGAEESKKVSKRRKRMAVDETEDQPNEEAVQVLKPKKSKCVKEGKDVQAQIKLPTVGGETHTQNKEETSAKTIAVGSKDDVKNEVDKFSNSKSGRKQNGNSSEPKTVNAFQRVKIDEVKFADDRLQDNSYWAKDGAEIGYGAKAQEVLGQVRGRDFRHEKTKKKRGSYRGGQIDLQSHSIKFDNSDDE